MQHSPANPLDLPIENTWLRNAVAQVSGLRTLSRWYDQWILERGRYSGTEAEAFLKCAVEKAEIELQLDEDPTTWQAARSGPVIFIANHPFGIVDSLLLAERLLGVRSDLKALANRLLLRFPELTEVLLGIDVFSQDASRANAASIRQLDKHLSRDGATLIFPAGMVSNFRLRNFKITDAPWHPMVGRLAKKHNATCIPIYIEGRNPFWFHLAGLLHKRLRTACLVNAMLHKRGSKIGASVGARIGPSDYERLSTPEAITDHLRCCTESMAMKSRAVKTNIPERKLKGVQYGQRG
ncbi:MAG: lysophospholipid acyltransferase family protein [Planctomycetota bacterium]